MIELGEGGCFFNENTEYGYLSIKAPSFGGYKEDISETFIYFLEKGHKILIPGPFNAHYYPYPSEWANIQRPLWSWKWNRTGNRFPYGVFIKTGFNFISNFPNIQVYKDKFSEVKRTLEIEGIESRYCRNMASELFSLC